jgi:hypothetical protein
MYTLRPFYAARAAAKLNATARHISVRTPLSASFSTTRARPLLASPLNLPKWLVEALDYSGSHADVSQAQ